MSQLTTSMDAALAHSDLFEKRIDAIPRIRNIFRSAQLVSLCVLGGLYLGTEESDNHPFIKGSAWGILITATLGCLWNTSNKVATYITWYNFDHAFDNIDSLTEHSEKNPCADMIAESTLPARKTAPAKSHPEYPETLIVSEDLMLDYDSHLNNSQKDLAGKKELTLATTTVSAAVAATFLAFDELQSYTSSTWPFISQMATIVSAGLCTFTAFDEKNTRKEQESLHRVFPDFNFPGKKPNISSNVTKEQRTISLPFPLHKFKIPFTYYNTEQREHN